MDGLSGWETATTFTCKDVLEIVGYNLLLIVGKIFELRDLVVALWDQLFNLLAIGFTLFEANADVASEVPRLRHENFLVLSHAAFFRLGFTRLEGETADNSAVDEEASGDFNHLHHAFSKLTSDVDNE